MADIGCMILENENILQTLEDNIDIISHVHFSAPNLVALSRSSFSSLSYSRIFYHLQLLKYTHKITIEMLNISDLLDISNSIYHVVKDPDINIIGAGWMGCHLCLKLLEQGYNPTLIEKTRIFAETSSKNQNRLHVGFHYPRSFETRLLCKRTFDQFMKCYESTCIEETKFVNLYVIANTSLMDRETYELIMIAENMKFRTIQTSDYNIHNCSSIGYDVPEKAINWKKAQEYFGNRLKNQICMRTEHNIQKNNANLIFDCTYNSFGTIANCYFIPTLSLIYQQK
jgi:hypothetical protein